jgi:hypothetical protein
MVAPLTREPSISQAPMSRQLQNDGVDRGRHTHSERDAQDLGDFRTDSHPQFPRFQQKSIYHCTMLDIYTFRNASTA